MTTVSLRGPGFSHAFSWLRIPEPVRRHGLTSLVLAVMVGLYLVAGLSFGVLGREDGQAAARVTPNLTEAVRMQVAPKPEPMQFKAIAPKDAVAINAAVPISDTPNPAARPFAFRGNAGVDRTRSIECLTAAVYYEAAMEGLDGQRAVAQVVLNRVRHPAYPRTVCGVVFEGSQRATGCQFTFTCDGALARTPHAGLWRQARQVAEAALAGKVFAPVGWATHYHTNWVVPYWSSSLTKAAIVGTHIFYRWEGSWGTASAFRHSHAGAEPAVAKLRHLTAAPAAEGEKPVDAAVLAAAEEAIAAEATNGKATDTADRAVIRRYEPTAGEKVTNILATQAQGAEKTASTSHLWALAGGTPLEADAPLGRKAEPRSTKIEPAKPAQPLNLSGVRRAGEPEAR